MPVITFRDSLRQLCPPWLRQGTAEKVLYAAGVLIDGFADALVAGVKSRFPGFYSGQSLPHIGRERRIRRGNEEADATYASRLIRWLDDHRLRGGPLALLAQLHAHYATAPFPIVLVYYPSPLLGEQLLWDYPPGIWDDGGLWSEGDSITAVARRYSMDVTGKIARAEAAWRPDDDAEHWARWWLFYTWPEPIELDGTWDSPGTWDDGGVWDVQGFTPDDIEALRMIPREWNAQHARGHIVLMPEGTDLWDYPPGIWDDGGVWGDTDNAAVTIYL